MRLAKREVTDPKALRAIVEACRTVRIGAQDDEGIFVVPMSFGYELASDSSAPDAADGAAPGRPHLTLWLHSAGEGRKAAAFRAGGAAGTPVAIEMDIEEGVISGEYTCAYSFAYRSIMGSGRIYPITDPVEKAQGLARIMEHLAPAAARTFPPEALERVAVWRVDVTSFCGKQRALKA